MRCSRRCPPWSSACAASRPDVRLFLFDVDGTLVTARGAGRAAFGRALQATYGTPGAVDVYDFRGKTDPRIVWDLMRGAGLDDAAITRGLDAFFAAYLEELRRAIGDGSRVQVMPGVAAVVSALAARDDALVGLLTGNIEAWTARAPAAPWRSRWRRASTPRRSWRRASRTTSSPTSPTWRGRWPR